MVDSRGRAPGCQCDFGPRIGRGERKFLFCNPRQKRAKIDLVLTPHDFGIKPPARANLAQGKDMGYSPRAISVSTRAIAGTAESPSPSPEPDKISVTFSTSPVITGYTLPVDKSKIKRSVAAQVTPADKAKKITISTSGADRITIKNLKVVGGNITFDVKGNSPTPADKPGGDTSIIAKYTPTDETVGEVKVIVKIPKQIGHPHPEPQGFVSPINLAYGRKSNPPNYNPPNGWVDLATLWELTLNIPVNDQFDQGIDGTLYEGVTVAEDIPNIGVVSIASLSGDGTYPDIVAVFVTSGLRVKEKSAAAQAWPNQPTLPFPYGLTASANATVIVGGHTLSPSISNRAGHASFTEQNYIQVVWPP